MAVGPLEQRDLKLRQFSFQKLICGLTIQLCRKMLLESWQTEAFKKLSFMSSHMGWGTPQALAVSKGERCDSQQPFLGLSPLGEGAGASLAPHERLPEILVVPREKTPTGAAARGNP